MNVINAAMTKAVGGAGDKLAGQSGALGSRATPLAAVQPPPCSGSAGSDLMAAMAATNSFLYAGLSPAAAALLPRLYAASGLFPGAPNALACPSSAAPMNPPPSSSSAAAMAAAAGLLTTVPQLAHSMSQPPGPDAPNPFMLADPSLWAAAFAGAGAGATGPPAHSNLALHSLSGLPGARPATPTM